MTRRNDDPTDAEIDRSQARMEHALGAGFADEPNDSGRLGSGFHYDVPSATYFSDPCHRPSLTQSIAKVLIERSPAHAWVQHPRLNPKHKSDDGTEFDVGNIAHRLLLGRGKDFVIIEANDWRTNAAKDAREAARAEGKLGILAKHHRIAQLMVEAAFSQLDQRGMRQDFLPANGDGEVVIVWQEGGLYFRAMIDWLAKDRLRVWDYKTTAASASPYAVDWKVADDGWDVQAAMHARGLDVLDPENIGRREHLFVVQENFEPYALTVVRLPEAVLTMGRKKLDAAVGLWAACTKENLWPSYSLDTLIASYPASAEARWLDREVREAENPPRRGGPLRSLMGG